MKKYLTLLLLILCMAGLMECNDEPSVSYELSFTVPAGSHDILFTSQPIFLSNGQVTIAADYAVEDASVLSVWFKDIGIEHAYEGNPYTNAVVQPGSTAKIEVESEAWYEIGILLTNASEKDVPVVITIED